MTILVEAKQWSKCEAIASCLIPRGYSLFVDVVSDVGKGTRLNRLHTGIKEVL